MIEIRIRHDFDDKAHRLCDWPATDLDRLIPTIGGWGVIGAGEYETKDLFGQVVLGDTGAYFEIVISTEDDA